MKKYKHWLYFDTFRTDHVKKTLAGGSNFKIIKFYNHPTKFCVMIIEIESENCYQDLDLDINSGSSYLKRYLQKPKGLGKGLTIKQYEDVYGKLIT